MSAANPISPSPALPLVYVGASVTVTTTPQNLLSLVRALTAGGGEYKAATGVCSELTLTNDPGSGNAIVICDSIAAASGSPPTSYGVYLNIGQSKTYPNGADLSRIYVAAVASTSQLDVEINNGCSTRW